MKRTELKRHTPLKAKTPLKRIATLNASPVARSNLGRNAGPKLAAKPRDTGPTSALVKQVLIRDEYACCLCGGSAHGQRGIDFSAHHRVLRSQGGQNTLQNLVTLCGSGTTGHHGWAHHKRKAAEEGGWIVRSCFNPADVAINHWQRGLIFLGADGSWSSRPFPTTPKEAT